MRGFPLNQEVNCAHPFYQEADMRKIMVVFSDAQWDKICDVARAGHRFPKQQIELWVCQALRLEQAGQPTKPKPPAKAPAPQPRQPVREGGAS